MTRHKDAIEMCICHILMQKKTLIRSRHYTSYKVFFKQAIGVKIVETLLSFRVDFKLGAQMAPSPAPLGQYCVFLFSTSLVDSGTTLIMVGEGGYPGNVLFGQVFFADNECVFASVFCWNVSQLILSPIVCFRKRPLYPLYGHL